MQKKMWFDNGFIKMDCEKIDQYVGVKKTGAKNLDTSFSINNGHQYISFYHYISNETTRKLAVANIDKFVNFLNDYKKEIVKHDLTATKQKEARKTVSTKRGTSKKSKKVDTVGARSATFYTD